MSASLEPREVLDRVPGLEASEFRIEALSGGLTNRVYKVSGTDATYVLRMNARHTGAFGLDRSSEIRILGEASSAGVAPAVVHADIDNGILLLQYIDGKVWTQEDLAIPGNIEALADLLQRTHALPLSGRKFDATGIANRYLDNLSAHEALLESGLRCRTIIEGIASSMQYCCCHNDVVAANVIASPNLMLLDWEYACDNDPLFDLASVIAYHALDGKIADWLLGAYAGTVTPELRERLTTQIRLYDAMHWLWLASRQVLSPDSAQVTRLEELLRTLG